jgi:1-acyl-sn-glycerol-3-phosphate acyltransferase
MITFRSLLFNVAFYVNLIVLMILGLPMMLRGRHGVFFMARLWGSTSVWLLEKLCDLRVEFRGVENLPREGYILAAKHQSFLETFALLKYTPDFAIILKRELVYVPIFGLYLLVAEQIGINRERGHGALAQIVAKAGAVLRAGRQVYIYPEGTRRPPGAPPAYKFGVAALYAATGAPCVPVALNTGLFWGRRGFTRRPGIAVIEFLPAIAPGMERSAFAERLQSSIESACSRLDGEAIGRDPSLGVVLSAAKASFVDS